MFGFTLSLSCRKGKDKKRKQKGGAGSAVKRAKISYWSKESICLRYTDQHKAPDTEEKVKLAQMGLGFQELKFELECDSDHIHVVLLQAYPALETCGGYSLLRLGSGLSSLVTIEPPRGGFTVRYLRDILKAAKLFIRPIQKDIESDDEEGESSNNGVCAYCFTK